MTETYDLSDGSGFAVDKDISAEKVSLQIKADGLDAADGVITLMQSNDRRNYLDLADNDGNVLNVTLPAGSSVRILQTDIKMGRYLLVKIAAGANSTGTLEFTTNWT